MRVSQKPNRTRGRGQRKPSGNNVNRVFESSGPEGKVRGTPQQIIEKYLSLARDAQTSGHRVVAENFLQHAEHYQRILIEATDARQERNANQQPGNEQPDAEQPEGAAREASGEPPAAAESGDKQNGGSGPNNRRRGGHEPRESEVSGLTMIDSGQGDAGSLLVDAEDLSASQPERRPRRRDQDQPQSPAPTDAPGDAATEASAKADAQPERRPRRRDQDQTRSPAPTDAAPGEASAEADAQPE